MTGDEDIAGSLPAPPPPAPARREAAIEAALRRFDRIEGFPATSDRPRRGWHASRPQLGALAGLALALLAGAPLAVQTLNQRSATSSPPGQASVAESPLPAAGVAEQEAPLPPQAASAVMSPGVTREPSRAYGSADGTGARSRIVASSTETKVQSESVVAAASDHAAAPAPAGIRAAPVIVPTAPPPPPPAIAAAPEASSAPLFSEGRAAASDTVVTGDRASRQLRTIDPADACTIDDPRRQLDLCRDTIDPGRPGREGRAAARIADGLLRAWQGDLAGAVAAFDQAIAIAPGSSIAYLNRGLVRQRRGDLDGAIVDLDRAVANAPNSSQALDRQARMLLGRGDTTRAKSGPRR